MRSLSRLLAASAIATVSLPAQAALLPPPVLAFKEGQPEETKYIEVAMVADAAQVAASGGMDGARQRLDEIASHANRILEGSGLSPRVRVAVVDRQIFEVDPFQASTANGYAPDEALLIGFSDWSQGLDQTKLDISVLITGQTLLASELGATRRTAVCWPGYNAALVRGGELSVEKSAEVLVHELGHLLGMWHDGLDNDCPGDQFLMRSEGGLTPLDSPKFSPCSQAEYQDQLNNSYVSICVHDVPTMVADSLCGDGVKSGSEECDCGNAMDCTEIDPCCDATTCKLVEGAACSTFNDEASCCFECQIATQGTTCREAVDECDSTEFCSGLSSRCPGDTWPETVGEACVDAAGYTGSCFAGRCQSGAAQCRVLGDAGNHNFTPPTDECDTGFMECAYTHCFDLDAQSCWNVGQPAHDGTSCSVGVCQAGQCLEANAVDECPVSGKTQPGVCGCDTPDDDIDGDGYVGCLEGCPDDPNKVAPGDCGCGRFEVEDCGEDTGQGGGPSEEPDVPDSTSGPAEGGVSHEQEEDDHADEVDELVTASEAEGCGCRSARSSASSPSKLLMLVGFCLVLRRTRRASSARTA